MQFEDFNKEKNLNELPPLERARVAGKKIGTPNVSEITEFKEDEKWFVRKRQHIRDIIVAGKKYVQSGPQYIGKNIEEIFEKRRKFYELLKKYLEDYLVDTEFSLTNDADGKKQIYLTQEFVDGEVIRTLLNDNWYKAKDFTEYNLPKEIMDQLLEINRIFIEEIQHDPEIIAQFKDDLRVIGGDGIRYGFGCNNNPFRYAHYDIIVDPNPFGEGHGDWSNIIVTPSGKLKIIDW